MISGSAALGLGGTWLAGPAALGLSLAARGSTDLGLCVGQLASASGAHPPNVSGVGSQLGFQLWAPSPLIWVRTTWLQLRAGAGYPKFTVQGLKREVALEAGAAVKSSLTSR